MTRPYTFFNFADLSAGVARSLASGIDAAVFAGERAILSIVSFAPGSEGSIHSHPEKQWGVLIEGSGTRIQDGVEVPVWQRRLLAHAVRHGSQLQGRRAGGQDPRHLRASPRGLPQVGVRLRRLRGLCKRPGRGRVR